MSVTAWVGPKGTTMKSVNAVITTRMGAIQKTITPIDDSLYVERPYASAADIEKVLKAAEDAQYEWKFVSVADRQNDYRTCVVRGRAELIETGADAHIDKLAKKYLDADTYPFRKPTEERIIVRVVPKSIIRMA